MATDESKVRRLLSACAHYRLDGTALVASMPIAFLVQAYNGIGPDWAPEIVRDAYTALHADFEPAAFIHDTDTELSDGTHEKFVEANERFLTNCTIIAKSKYAWYNPVRYWRLHQARSMYRLLVLFGWTAWQAAYKRNTASVG